MREPDDEDAVPVFDQAWVDDAKRSEAELRRIHHKPAGRCPGAPGSRPNNAAGRSRPRSGHRAGG